MKGEHRLGTRTWTITHNTMTSILFWVVVALLALFALLGIAVVLFTGYFVFIKKADEINIQFPKDD